MKRTLKAIFSGVLCLAVCWSLASCKNSQNTGDAHGHSEEIHEGHSHDGHVHDHEGHEHGAHENHAGHDHSGHSHEGDIHSEGEGSPDEIILSAESAAAAGVKAETIMPGKFRSVLEVSGRIMPAPGNESTVVANVPGVVSFAAPLVEGSRVNEGSPMFTISSSNLQDGDPVQRARIAYETAQKEYERAAKLVEDNIVSRQEYEAAKGRYETARLTYEALAADGSGNGTAVKSPASGYVESCLVKEGDYVSVGTPLATVLSGNSMYLKADVSERYLSRLPGVKSANFRLSYSDKVFSTAGLNGRLLGYGRSTDETNAYIPVTFAINASDDILAGAYAQIWLLSEERDGVISLPVEAITEEQGHNFVYIQLDRETVVTHGAIHVKLASASNAIPAHSHSH